MLPLPLTGIEPVKSSFFEVQAAKQRATRRERIVFIRWSNVGFSLVFFLFAAKVLKKADNDAS